MFHVKRAAQRLPRIERDDFDTLIRARSPAPLEPASRALLFGHYQALQRWSARLALIGPGTAEEVLDRHYGESLAALPWVDELRARQESGLRLIDIGSGAGFPGIVLGLARPGLDVALIESRGKKCAFLEASLRSARAECQELVASGEPGIEPRAELALDALSVQVVNARIESPLPAGMPARFDLVTSRAVRLSPAILEPLIARQPDARYLLWLGARTELPPSLEAVRQHRHDGSHGRILVEATISS